MSYISPLGTPASIQPAPAPRQSETAHASAQHELLVFWRSLLRRKRLFLAIVVGFVAIVALLTILTPKSYTTTVRLMAGNSGQSSSSGNTALPILNALLVQSGVQTAETFAALAQQQSIADTVVKNLGLQTTPSNVLSRVTVTPVTNTALLDLSFKWSNPEDSARIANEFAKVFTDTERTYVQGQATGALGFLNAELPRAEKRMHDAANSLADFQARNGIIEETSQTQQVVAQEGQVQAKIQDLTLDLQGAQALDSSLRSEMGGMPAGSNPILTDLKTNLAQVESKLAIAREQYTEAHPAVVALVQQRDALRSQIAAQSSGAPTNETVVNPNPVYQSLQQQEAAAKARVNADTADLVQLHQQSIQIAKTMTALPQKSIELGTLQQRAKSAADVFQALQQKHTEATIAQTTAISDVAVIQPATADGAVVTPSLARNLTVAPIVGLILATLVIFALDYFERTLRDSTDVEKVIGLPVMASIPLMESNSRRALPWVQSVTLEAFLHLCVSLGMSKRRPLRSLAITSPSIGDGKSTIAFNLAKALSNLQPPVLLVDADMRRSVLHLHGERPNESGLSDVLTGERTLDDCVQEISPQFHLLSAGKSVASPFALIQSSRFDDLLTEAAQRYSLTIIDSPALACVADGFAIARRVDGTALVIAANATDERVAKDVVSHFAKLGIDNLLGVVLNKDRQRFSDYSDYFAGATRDALPKGSA